MSMKKVFFICLLLVACQSKVDLNWENTSVKKQSSIVLEGGSSTEAHFVFPTCDHQQALCESLSIFFVKKSSELLGFNYKKDITYEKLAEKFIHSYEQIHKQLPNPIIPWEAKLQGNIHALDKVYNPTIEYYIFTGGTSIDEGIAAAFIDKKTQKNIPIKKLFLNYIQFEKMVEQQFIAQFGDYRSKEFYFENGKFKISQNHYIKDNSWVVSYATGEIAPMYKGVFEVKIPMEDLQSVLNPMYF